MSEGGGDGQDPRPHDAAGDAPADSGQPACRADADDGAGNGVGGATGTPSAVAVNSDIAPRRLRREPTDRLKAGDLLIPSCG